MSTTVVSTLDCVPLGGGGGGGSYAPPVGMLPAKIVPESAQVSTTAIANRLIDFAPLS